MKPVLFVTGHAPADRVKPFSLLHEAQDVEFALFAGRSAHGAPPGETVTLPFPHRHVAQRDVLALAASGRYRAVICGTGGRIALPAAWSGARAARVPLVLWAALWAHPRTAAHAVSYLPLVRLYRSADAVVTYGAHVSAYVRARGARNVHIAAQAVDNAFWSQAATARAPSPSWPSDTATRFLFVGRAVREKGIETLLSAWRLAGLMAPTAGLVLVGTGPLPASRATVGDAHSPIGLEPVSAPLLRNFYAAADVLVMPSLPTRAFREPWGLVANEAMNQHLPVIASDAVGAAAGGLVRHEHNGLVVPAGQAPALAAGLRRLSEDRDLRRRLGDAGAHDVQAFTPAAWAAGFSAALGSVGVAQGRC